MARSCCQPSYRSLHSYITEVRKVVSFRKGQK
jgi:hypothetical protein